ncbi:hypothetical protein JI57_01340 [Psychromonas sp. PRT-SC03]|nr:hypothetical protein JI57_01340 [Psychromonas sp. PRT-SC03]
MNFLKSFKGRIISVSALLVVVSLCVSNFWAYEKLKRGYFRLKRPYTQVPLDLLKIETMRVAY